MKAIRMDMTKVMAEVLAAGMIAFVFFGAVTSTRNFNDPSLMVSSIMTEDTTDAVQV